MSFFRSFAVDVLVSFFYEFLRKYKFISFLMCYKWSCLIYIGFTSLLKNKYLLNAKVFIQINHIKWQNTVLFHLNSIKWFKINNSTYQNNWSITVFYSLIIIKHNFPNVLFYFKKLNLSNKINYDIFFWNIEF